MLAVWPQIATLDGLTIAIDYLLDARFWVGQHRPLIASAPILANLLELNFQRAK